MNQDFLQIIKDKLKKVENKKQRYFAVSGLLRSVSIFTILVFSLVLLETVFHFSSAVRTIILYVFISFAFYFIIAKFVVPLLKSLNLINKVNFYKTAQEVGNYFPEIKDELLDSLQLVNEDSTYHSSKELVNAEFQRVYRKTQNLDFTAIVKKDKITKTSGTAVTVLTIVSFLIYFLPFFSSATIRLLHFDKEYITLPSFELTITPGNISVLKGKTQNISVTVKGKTPDKVELYTKSENEAEFNSIIMRQDSTSNFSLKLNQIHQSLEYFAQSGSIKSKLYKIKVLNPPIIKNLTLEIIAPNYTKMPNIVQHDDGNISALLGSKVNMTFRSTKRLESAELIFSYKKKLPAKINKNTWTVNFSPKKDGTYFIEIKDTSGNKNSNPIVYSIKLSADEFPTMNIISPKNNIRVIGSEQLPAELRVRDDFGFSKLLLFYRLSATKFGEPEKKFKSIIIPLLKNATEQDVYYNWDLTKLYLAVGDEIAYYFELFDNDNISGPKSVKSGLFKLRVPSMNETFDDAEKVQKNANIELAKTLEESKKLSKEINKLSNKLKRDDKKISWEEKEKIQNTVKKFNDLEKKVDKIKDQISKAKQKLDKNNLLSKETIQKYNELQKLMDQLSSPEMKNALKKLQEMMQKMNRDKVQNSFENFKMNEEAFKKSLERTLNLLKRIQIEQKVDELTKRTADLEKRQTELEKETEKKSSSETSKNNKRLQEKQNDITKDLKQLSEKMKDLQKMMSEVPKMPNSEMQKMMDEMQKQNNQKLSENSSQMMMQQQMKQSSQMQKQIANNMKKLNKRMSAMKSNMQMQNQIQTMTEMMKIISQIIDLSQQEELLKQESKNLNPASKQSDNNIRKQEEIKNDLGNLLKQMAALSQKTFAISPEMGNALGKAARNMDESQRAMQNRNGYLASSKQGAAMGNLNEAAKMMGNAMQAMMKPGGQGGGMMSLLQQLQKLSGQQMSLNQLTQRLGQNGRMTQQQMAQLQRLAQQQGLIKKSMQALNKEAKETGQSKKLPVDFDRVIQDMKEVITGMKTQKLDAELITTQNRILSKLLDAQRSINEKDYEKRRESNSGTDIVKKSPEQIDFEKKQNSDEIRRELLNSIKEGYSKDYQELIRNYFEALQKEKN